ncbi:MAG: hypothetical protein ACRDY6_09360 [Acidimicrobiia bacterium]
MPGAFVKHIDSVESSARAFTHTLVVPAGGVAAGNTILLGLTTNDWINRVIEVDDDRGNTWAEDILDATESGTYKVCSRIFHCHVTTALQAGDEITISIDPSGDTKSCAAWADEFSGILTLAALDQAGSGHGGSTHLVGGGKTGEPSRILPFAPEPVEAIA